MNPGAPLPAFTLADQDGEQRSLPDGSGASLLVFYRGDW